MALGKEREHSQKKTPTIEHRPRRFRAVQDAGGELSSNQKRKGGGGREKAFPARGSGEEKLPPSSLLDGRRKTEQFAGESPLLKMRGRRSFSIADKDISRKQQVCAPRFDHKKKRTTHSQRKGNRRRDIGSKRKRNVCSSQGNSFAWNSRIKRGGARQNDKFFGARGRRGVTGREDACLEGEIRREGIGGGLRMGRRLKRHRCLGDENHSKKKRCSFA